MQRDNLAIAVSYEGEREVDSGGVSKLAELYRQMQYGADIRILSVAAMDESGTLVPVKHEMLPYSYDDNSMAYPVVKVTMPDGLAEWATFSLDGRA